MVNLQRCGWGHWGLLRRIRDALGERQQYELTGILGRAGAGSSLQSVNGQAVAALAGLRCTKVWGLVRSRQAPKPHLIGHS